MKLLINLKSLKLNLSQNNLGDNKDTIRYLAENMG